MCDIRAKTAAALVFLFASTFALVATASETFAGQPELNSSLAALRTKSAALRRSGAAMQGGSDMIVWRGPATAIVEKSFDDLAPFNRAVLSWNATGPVRIELEVGGIRHVMGVWGDEPRSVKGDSAVVVDTLVLDAPARALKFRVIPVPGTTVTLVTVAHWTKGEKKPLSSASSAAWGKTLSVPQRSQSAGGVDTARICSPTSLAMVLESYGVDKPTAEVARGVYDHGEGIYGNWPFNTAYAHKVTGLESYVQHSRGLEDLEREIAAGRPVVIAVKWQAGDLDNAPITKTDGHVIVVVGFTAAGDVVVNDPAGKPGETRRVYKRDQLYKIWLERAQGIAYILKPA